VKAEAGVMTGQRTRTATVSGPVTGGRGWPFGSPADAGQHGYLIEEFLLDGVAQSYEPAPGGAVGRDGRWTVQPGERARYRTRMYVARPADPARFNGIVIAYWLNVTAGFDLGAPSEHEMRAGYAWAGITTQAVAVDGQPSLAPGFPATRGLPRTDPARYGTLHHPGDAYSYDIFTQAARAVGPDRPASGPDPLGGLTPRLVLAVGASQSSARLGAYLNMADDTERCVDGYLLLTHWGLCVYPPDQPMMVTFAPLGDGYHGGSSAINDRGRVPVLVLNSESETLHNVPVRQPDSPTFRFWEIAGAAHTGESPDFTPMLEREGLPVFPPAPDANTIDWRWVRNAALEHLARWAGGGAPPPSFPLIDASLDAGIHRDETGNATGGIRVPELAAPTAAHSGSRPGNPLAALVGQSVPYPPEVLAVRYPDAGAYLREWDAAVDRARGAGLLLDTDLAELRQRGRTVAAGLWPA
jgi:Alpha/beta hydrolase domain